MIALSIPPKYFSLITLCIESLQYSSSALCVAHRVYALVIGIAAHLHVNDLRAVLSHCALNFGYPNHRFQHAFLKLRAELHPSEANILSRASTTVKRKSISKRIFVRPEASEARIPKVMMARGKVRMSLSLERDLLMSKVPEWDDLKGTGRQRNEDGDLVHLKDDFIDDLVGEFFAHFPERDAFHNPASPDAMTQDERDRLHTRIRQFLYNHSSDESERKVKRMANPYKNLSLMSLYKQRFSNSIVKRRDELLADEEYASPLHAYNKAATELFTTFNIRRNCRLPRG
ncbi:hypothetical protein BDV93DRAFT_512552 [Ceratobasidium sp. AG-I]|nr:hypothetical protein BDV93DRAFT_512552 [Ceratobasidium sp. AG-I]